jgi:hypothetical protein
MMSTLCIASVGIVGSARKVVEPDQYSGFLMDQSQLREAQSPSGATVMRWIDPKPDMSKYINVYLDPTQLYPKPQPMVKNPQAIFKGITGYYDQAPKFEIGKSLPLAAGTDPGDTS